MEERSLRVVGTDKTFFNKLTNTLTKILIPTQIGINGMRISMKRNALIKAYENSKEDIDANKKEIAEKKYKNGEFILDPGDIQFTQMCISKPASEVTEWSEF